jgi:hypothetical protein
MRLLGVAMLLCLIAGTVTACGGNETKTVTESISADTTEPDSELVPVVALTPPVVEECLERGDVTILSSEDLNPGSPINAHGVFGITANSGARVGIVLTLRPFITKRLSRELAEEGEYDINVTPSEEAIVIFDAKATPEDEGLASECSEPK